MRRKNIWKPDFDAIAELMQEFPGEIEAFVQKVLNVSSIEMAALKLVKTKEQRKRLIELLQQDGDGSTDKIPSDLSLSQKATHSS